MTWLSLTVFCSLLMFCGSSTIDPANDAETATSASIDSPQTLIEAMRARYDGKWYETFTFVQTTIQHRPNGSIDTTIWYEALSVPGKLRIDFAPPESGNGILFKADTISVFQNGSVSQTRPQIHPLLLLGFDVYFLEPAETLRKLKALGFNLEAMHESEWQGRPVYVVGTASADENVAQFWIDQEHLYFVRSLQPTPNGVSETQFNKYERLAGGWVAPEVLFFFNGNVTMEEYYNNMRANVTIDEALYDPTNWPLKTGVYWE